LKAKRPPGLWRDRGDRSGSKKGTAGAGRYPPQDFLTTPTPTTDPFSIVCHPPFKLARAFVELIAPPSPGYVVIYDVPMARLPD
jgi:hypothetical protein